MTYFEEIEIRTPSIAKSTVSSFSDQDENNNNQSGHWRNYQLGPQSINLSTVSF